MAPELPPQGAACKAKPLAHDVAEKLRACERECQWLREELDRLELMPADSPRAARLQKRLGRYHREWLAFLEHPALAPTNNCAEQALRALVILRKLTFGSRTLAGSLLRRGQSNHARESSSVPSNRRPTLNGSSIPLPLPASLLVAPPRATCYHRCLA